MIKKIILVSLNNLSSVTNKNNLSSFFIKETGVKVNLIINRVKKNANKNIPGIFIGIKY